MCRPGATATLGLLWRWSGGRHMSKVNKTGKAVVVGHKLHGVSLTRCTGEFTRTVIDAGVRVETSVAESIVRFESRTVIQGPVSEVFERLADLPGYGGWMHRTGLFRGCSLTSEVPVRRGTTYLDSTRMGTFDGEVTEFVPPTRIAFRETLRWFGSPMTQARPEYSLEGDESATVVHHVAVGELYGRMRFMKPAAAWMANRERSRTLNSLKRSLESE